MPENQFQIFIPNRWSWLEINIRLLILIIIFIGICMISEACFPNTAFTDSIGPLTLVFSITAVLIVIFGSRLREPLYGKLEGILVLKVDEIRVNDCSIPISDIKRISFSLVDYLDMQLSMWGRLLNARKSQGVNNKCVIEIKGGEKIQLRFRRMDSTDQNKFRYEFFAYYIAGKLAFTELTKILNCSDYNAIQCLRKEIEEYKNVRLTSGITT